MAANHSGSDDSGSDLDDPEQPGTSRALVVAGCSAVAMVLIGMLTLALTGSDAPEFATLESISMPNAVDAGTTVSLDVTSNIEFGTAEVQVTSAYGTLSFAVPISSNSGQLELPEAVTRHAGLITVTSGDVSASLTVAPADVAEIVAPLVGPRTIVADGDDVTMAVVLPVDRYGNLVADRTPVAVEWQQPSHPGDPVNETRVDVATENGLVSLLLPSGVVAGPTQVRAIAETGIGDEISGAAVRIDEVPGAVTDIVLTAAGRSGLADGRSLLEVETAGLFDAFENQLADGTVGHFVFDGPSGNGVVPGRCRMVSFGSSSSPPTSRVH